MLAVQGGEGRRGGRRGGGGEGGGEGGGKGDGREGGRGMGAGLEELVQLHMVGTMYNLEQEENLRHYWVVICHRFALLVKCFCFIMWRFTESTYSKSSCLKLSNIT